MNIENQLIEFLHGVMKAHETRDRNVELIAHFYGFRDAAWPTLEATAGSFGISTRERVRQIIERDLKKVASPSALPTLGDLSQLISEREFWLGSELESRIRDSGMVGSRFSIPGLLSLISDVNLSNAYQTYPLGARSTNLQPASRRTFNDGSTSYITKPDIVDEFNPVLNKLRTLPGQYGIANLEYLKDKISVDRFNYFLPFIISVLDQHPFAWRREINSETWYMFEDRDNVLLNHCEKVFTVFEQCDTQRLAGALSKALTARSQKREYPTAALIHEFLTSSACFHCKGDEVRFANEPETQLTEIDEKVLQYLAEHGSTNFTTIRQFLSAENFSESLISRAVMHSPLVFVDESRGKKKHQYSLVAEHLAVEDRYETYRRRLGGLRRTDRTTEQIARAEQPLLRKWLFGEDEENKEQNCAACGETFSVNALVAAHKKPRVDCNEAERRDPYIVMPMCKFGCDYLYENGHVFVSDGVLTEGVPLKQQGTEADYLENLVGRTLDARWLRGEPSYFRKPPPESMLGN